MGLMPHRAVTMPERVLDENMFEGFQLGEVAIDGAQTQRMRHGAY